MTNHAECAAPGCQKPAHNGYLCASCVSTLSEDLRAVPILLEDLNVTISKQDRIAAGNENRRSQERPLPLRLGPMEAKRELTMRLASWVTYLDANYPFMPATDAADLATYLTGRIDDLQRDEQVGICADEIGYIVITARRAVDKPLALVYVGPCDKCTSDLYAHPRKDSVMCGNTECRAQYNIAERRDWLLRQAEDRLLTAAEMSRALPGLLQKPLTAAMIRNWAHRGRIVQHPPLPDRPRDPVYRVGDVITLVSQLALTPARR